MRHKMLTKKDLIIKLHQAGRTVPQMAAALETTEHYVRHILQLAGVKPNVEEEEKGGNGEE